MNLFYSKSGMIKFVFVLAVFLNNSLTNVLAITHDKKITRPETFGTIPGQRSVDMKTYDASLVRVVTPVPLSTMVEVMRIHAHKEFNEFSTAHAKALMGKRPMMGMGDPFDKRAKDHYKIMIQDYMPMNEADAAAARYLFSVKNCALRADPKAPSTGLTPCQYSGAKILSDIVKRLQPIHALITLGSITVIPDAKVSVEIQQPKELIDQIRRIVSLLGTEEIAGYLRAADNSAALPWKHIRAHFS